MRKRWPPSNPIMSPAADFDGNFTGALGIPTLDGLGVCGDGVHTKQEHLGVSSIVPRTRPLAGLYEAPSDRNS